MDTSCTIPSDFITLRQAALEGPFSKRTLWHLISSGQLTAYRPLQKKLLIKRSSLARLIESRRVGADLDTLVDETLAELSQPHG